MLRYCCAITCCMRSNTANCMRPCSRIHHQLKAAQVCGGRHRMRCADAGLCTFRPHTPYVCAVLLTDGVATLRSCRLGMLRGGVSAQLPCDEFEGGEG